MASSIVTVSVIEAWKEGTTVDAIKTVEAKFEAVAQSLDGVILLDRGEPGEWLDVEIVGGYGTDLDGVVRGPA